MRKLQRVYKNFATTDSKFHTRCNSAGNKLVINNTTKTQHQYI